MVRKREHPAHRRLRDGAVDGARGDAEHHVGGGAGGDIDAVVADPEPGNDEQLSARGQAPRRDAWREDDNTVDAGELLRGDLRNMVGEATDREAAGIREAVEANVLVFRLAVGLVEVGGQRDGKRKRGSHRHGFPSGVAQASATMIRSGTGPAYTQSISMGRSDSLTK